MDIEKPPAEDAEKDLKTARRTKCRIWLKAKLAYWINRCIEAEKDKIKEKA